MKTILKILIIGLVGFTFSKCGNSANNDGRVSDNVREMEDDFKREKEQLQQNLDKFRDDVNARLKDIGDKIDNASDNAKVKLRHTQQDLQAEKEKLDLRAKEVKNSTRENWEDVKEDTNSFFTEVRRNLKKAGANIQEAFDNDGD